jgi:antirestriction protein ArdC
MPSQTQIRDEVTARIIEALEADLLPWRRPWRATVGGSQPGRHSNVASRKPYQGVNQILLELHAMRLGLLSRWWGTLPFNLWVLPTHALILLTVQPADRRQNSPQQVFS